MSDEQVRRIIEDSYAKEEALLTMARDFYSRKMLSKSLVVWVWAAAFIALAVYSAMRFFKAGQTQAQIMYAVLFISGVLGLGLMKILAWLMLHQHGIRRDLKRMELRIAELNETLKSN